MGLLDKWIKKTQKEQLDAIEEKNAAISDEKQKKEAKHDHEDVKVGKKTKKTTKTEKNSSEKKMLKVVSGNANKILLYPVVSEKASIGESLGKYTFAVALKANKIKVANAVKDLYGVKVDSVRMINVEGKKARFGRQSGRRSDRKKAIVTLAKGESINIHSGV